MVICLELVEYMVSVSKLEWDGVAACAFWYGKIRRGEHPQSFPKRQEKKRAGQWVLQDSQDYVPSIGYIASITAVGL